MLPWIKKPETSSTTAFLPCSPRVCDGYTNTWEKKWHRPENFLLFWPLFLRGIGKQCEGCVEAMGAWPSDGRWCTHQYQDPGQGFACRLCQVIWLFISFHSLFTPCRFEMDYTSQRAPSSVIQKNPKKTTKSGCLCSNVAHKLSSQAMQWRRCSSSLLHDRQLQSLP